MLSCCGQSRADLLIEFNCKKSSCIVVGPAVKYNIDAMTLCNDTVNWSNAFKYLGACFMSGKTLTVDINSIKRKFYVSCNCILGNTNTMDELLKLSLMESYRLPILTYATAAINLSSAQINELNICWNSVYRRIFGFNKWESVRGFINGLGRLDFTHLRLYLRLKFHSRNLASANKSYAFVTKLYCLSANF